MRKSKKRKVQITCTGHESFGELPRLHGACAECSRSIQNDKTEWFVILEVEEPTTTKYLAVMQSFC